MYEDDEDEDDSDEAKKPVASASAAASAAPPESAARKMTEADVAVMRKIRFLGRSGIITEVKGAKVQVLFTDNERKEWVKKDGLLLKGTVESNTA